MFHSICYRFSIAAACLLFLLPSRTIAHYVPRQSTNSSRGEWWREPFGQLQTNLREIDADMDVNEVIDFIEQHGATAWLIGVGGILANYPTELDFQMSNPYLEQRESGDLIQDALDAARARGMRLLARMDFSKVQANVANEHPDWLYRNPEGGTQNHTNGLVSVCPSGEYYQERIFDILEEVMRRYEMDGFFVNWSSFNEVDYFKVYHGVCHCDNCQKRWSEWAGDLELPKGREDPTYPQWQNFSSEIIDEWTARVQALIAERLPDAGLMLGTSAKILFHEANNAVDREMWHFATSEAVSKEVSYRPDVPVLVNSVAFVDMPYRMGSEEPSMYAQYILQTISRGGNPSTYIMGIPGKIPYSNLNIAGQITSFHRDHKKVYNGMHPIAKTGLVAPDGSLLNSTQYDEAESEFQGLYTAMQELHIPFDVLEMARIAATAEYRGLDGYDVLILPNIGTLQAADAEALDSWATSGGRVIATGSVGINDGGDVQLASLPAQREMQVITEREKLWSTYFAPAQNRPQENYYNGPIVPIYGAHRKYDWKNGTRGIYKLLDFAPFAPPEYAYGNIQGDEAGASIASYDSGKGIMIPFAIGRGYRELGLSVYRDFFSMVLEEEGTPDEKLIFDFAEQVDITLNQNGNMTIVHLINASGARKQNFGKWLPVPSGSIQIKGGKNGSGDVTARALLSGVELEVKNGTIEVPGLDLWEVIVIEGLN